MRLTLRTLLYASALALVGLAAACGDQGERESLHTFDVGAAPVVIVETFGGEVVVRRGTPGVVDVTVVQRNPQRIAFEADERDGVVTVRARQAGGLSFGRLDVGAAVSLTVPALTRLDIRVTDGAVRVSDVRGGIRIQAERAEVNVSDAVGALDVQTTEAPVRVVGFTGDASLITSGADVAVTVAAGSFQVSTADGRVDLEAMLRTGSTSTLRTTGAPVSVRLRGPGAELDVAAPGGSVVTHDQMSAVVTSTAELLLSTLGAGGATLVVRTTDAAVTIGAP